MKSLFNTLFVAVYMMASAAMGQQPEGDQAKGPLRVHPTNPRYFTDGTRNSDGSLRGVYLTGTHTWANLSDNGIGVGVGSVNSTDPPPVFDYNAYLDLMQTNNHNFIRLWRWELPKTIHSTGPIYFAQPHPWLRGGPGTANDGKLKFDLNQFDQSYFDRLRSRVIAARDRGIYVGIMLFEGWYLSGAPDSWQYHPLHSSNNVNGINGDANGNGRGEETHTLQVPAVLALQKAYVCKVIDTVNDLDNVLYEIANESAVPGSTQWQYELIKYIKSYQAKKPKQHPVGMTSQAWSLGPKHDLLWNSPADWVSLGQATSFDSQKDPYISNPPAAPGGKVSILDTDHLGWKVYVDDATLSRAWVWKSFLRGHNPILMEDLKDNSGWIAARAAMGHTRTYANKMNLAAMTPQNDLSTTSFCLANSDKECLVYEPGTGEFSVNLTAGNYAFEWFDPTTGSVASTGSVKAAGGNQTFTPPFAGPAVLYLKVESAEAGAASSATPAPKLGISGDKLTIGGRPTFLLGVSYFDALGWSNADLDAFQARRFNLIRIFLDWSILAIKDGIPSPLAPRGFINSDGSLKNTETLLNLIRACAARGIVVDVTILNAIYDAANPTSTILDMQSRENAIRNAVRLLKHEPNVFFDVCNEHDVAWNGKTTTLTHAEVTALIRAALAEHPDAIVTVSSGGDHLPNARNTREELDAGVMLVSPHFQRTPDWFDRTDDRVKSAKEHIKSFGGNVPVYLQEEQRRSWSKTSSPPKSEFLQAAREAVSSGAAGWVFHTVAAFDLRSSNLLANLDSVEREVLDSLGAEVFGAAPPLPGKSSVLRVHPTNSRYFTDGTQNPDESLRAVYLTGSHTWNNLVDMGRGDPPEAFDFDAYLDILARHDHNFIRLWAWNSTVWDLNTSQQWTDQKTVLNAAPQPWLRTGPGKALDGKPKFDLEKIDPAYFERLRARVKAAGQRGIYVSVMLFEGWALSFDSTSWRGHPFRVENNVQGIDGDPNGDGKGLEIQTLTIPRVTAAQEAYVRKVIDTVNDLDNVLYEISNEARLLDPASSTKDWQYHMIRFIKNEEAKKDRQHPVGMTSQGGGGGDDSEILRHSPADWISPNPDKFDYKNNPPASDGKKVVLLDTDHLWGVGGDAAWVWKSFLRGHNPLFMDPYDHLILGKGRPDQWEGVRQAMGATRGLARRIDLVKMTPSLDLASTRYCLAKPGQEYLVYQPGTGEFSVNLAVGNYAFEWFNPTTRSVVSTGSVKAAGGNQTFAPPFAGPAVLFLKSANAEAGAASRATPAAATGQAPPRAGKAAIE